MKKKLLDCGLHPVSNRYLCVPDENEIFYPLILSQYQKSGLITLSTPFPNEELIPKFDWITYNEPEDHLNYLVDILCDLKGVSEGSIVGGVSFKDDTTLQRFKERSCNIWRIDPIEDLHILNKGAGIESIQSGLNRDLAEEIALKYGVADILIARHILEHVYNLAEFIASLKKLVKESAYIIFEVPDCSKALDNNDYTMIWEEHLYYFTPETFKYILNAFGFRIVRFETISYPLENSLIAITQSTPNTIARMSEEILLKELLRGEYFSRNFNKYYNNIRSFFETQKKNNGKIAFFGAGHLACTFIWLFQLQDYIDCVIDDDPNKQGLFMPGSKINIVSSSSLVHKEHSIFILSMNPLNEEKVVSEIINLIECDGSFFSIFASSPRSLHKEIL